jgi:site-specific DNA-methyltransferase (adenine-specific)
MIKIENYNCLDFMKCMPDNSVDLILTDPPYNISKLNDNRDRSKLNSAIMRRKSPLKYDFGKWDNMSREEFIGRKLKKNEVRKS